MTKALELREMSDEQLGLTLNETCEHFSAFAFKRKRNVWTRQVN